ncbi:MAG: HNH endonuclease [Muribaculaceae bacterium]|nr:HNH endonuclease [Muribaculaceae bacterium]
MSRDPDYKRMIHSARWQKLRRDIISASPLCERCRAEGYVTAATEVHHRIPVEQGFNRMEKKRLMFDPHNLVALCRACHVKTHTEMGRSGKDATRKRNSEHVQAVIRRFYGSDTSDEPPGGVFLNGEGVPVNLTRTP